MTSQYHRVDFQAQGQLLDFIIKKGDQVEYLRMIINQREYWIKVAKPLRNNLDPAITPGAHLEIIGEQKQCAKTGTFKWKAEEVRLISSVNPTPGVKVQNKTILVCQKSACAKRGSQQLCKFLTSTLESQGLQEQVQIKLTGCMNQCKQGPNFVIMPDKAHYKAVDSEQLERILAKHF